MTKIVSTDKARQGHWGRHVLIVLVAALLLAAVAWGIAEILRRRHRALATGSVHGELNDAVAVGQSVLLACGSAGTSTFSAFL